MKRALSGLVLILAFGVSMKLSPIPAETTSTQVPPFEVVVPVAQDNFAGQVQQIAVDLQSSSGVPAVAIVVVNSEGIIGTGAAGFRKSGNAVAIQVMDAFHIGSVTKAITATLLAKLVEQRKLSWESTPAQVFPEWKDQIDPALETITMAQILAHQAGFAPFTDDKELGALPPFAGDAREQRRQFTKYLLTRKPSVSPGTQYRYSKAGYTVAAAMAERVARNSWEALVKKYVFTPLKLTSARFGWPARQTMDAP